MYYEIHLTLIDPFDLMMNYLTDFLEYQLWYLIALTPLLLPVKLKIVVSYFFCSAVVGYL